MPWMMPQMPPELLKVLGAQSAQGNAPASPAVVPPATQPMQAAASPAVAPAALPTPAPVPAPVATPGTNATAIPQEAIRSSLAPGTPKPAASDDPGVNNPTLPTPPDPSQSPVAAAYKRYSDLAAQRSAIKQPNRADYKPNWKDKVLGVVLGGLAGMNDPVTGARAGVDFTNRKFNRAQADYNSQTGALDKQLEAERGGLAEARDASEATQRDFENKMAVAREKREQNQVQDKMDRYGAKFVAGTEERDPNSPTGWTAETASGERKPFTPKSATAAPKEPKNADEALSAASAEKDPAEKARLLQLAKDLHKQEVDRVREGRPDAGGKPASYSDKRAVQKEKDSAEQRAKQEFDKATEGLKPDDEEYLRARGNYIDKMQSAQTAYEQGIRNFGGSPEEITYDSSGVAHKSDGSVAKPAAQPGSSQAKPAAAPPTAGKAAPKVGDVRTMKGGKQVRITKIYKDGTFDAEPVGGK